MADNVSNEGFMKTIWTLRDTYLRQWCLPALLTRLRLVEFVLITASLYLETLVSLICSFAEQFTLIKKIIRALIIKGQIVNLERTYAQLLLDMNMFDFLSSFT